MIPKKYISNNEHILIFILVKLAFWHFQKPALKKYDNNVRSGLYDIFIYTFSKWIWDSEVNRNLRLGIACDTWEWNFLDFYIFHHHHSSTAAAAPPTEAESGGMRGLFNETVYIMKANRSRDKIQFFKNIFPFIVSIYYYLYFVDQQRNSLCLCKVVKLQLATRFEFFFSGNQIYVDWRNLSSLSVNK